MMQAKSHPVPREEINCVFRDIVSKDVGRDIRYQRPVPGLPYEKKTPFANRCKYCCCRSIGASGRRRFVLAAALKRWNDSKELQRTIEEKLKQVIRRWSRNDRGQEGYYREFLARISSRRWLQEYAGPETEEILKFCQKNGILKELKAAIDLTKMIFPSLRNLSVGLSRDPEWETEKVVLSVMLGCDSEEAFAAYDKYITKWIDTASWEARKQFCLSYHIG